MCGFTGFYSKNKTSSEVILKMNDAIKHRGPDDEGYFFGDKHFSGKESMSEIKTRFEALPNSEFSNVAMGFRRLSIVDLSENGHQPMSFGNLHITFNGEIYNFRELRAVLEKEGAVFQSNSDTEVILLGYQHWGIDVIQKLDGMFSFCIFDSAKKELIFARDRLGLKPLYYFKNEEGLFWASEIKSLLNSGKIQPEINWDGVQSNFMYQTTVSPQTCFKNIFSLEPAHYAVYDIENQSFNFYKYYEFPNKTDSEIQKDEAVKKVDELLRKNIEKQLYADVPVISMMSGGIDSTLISVLAKENNQNLEAFTLSYQNADEEVENASEVASINDIKHFIEKIDSFKILQNLKENIAFFEEPYPALEVLVNASEFGKNAGYKVILSGNGADELFGGYGHLLKLEKWKKTRKFSFLKYFLPKSGRFSLKIRNFLSQNSVEEFFRNGQSGMKLHEIEQLFGRKVQLQKFPKNGNYQRYFLEDMTKSLASHHAYRDDLSAMKYSVEFRYPYLSNELVDFVAKIPEDIRFNGILNKPLLREVAQKYLPKSVLNMKKRGFTFPVFQWFQNDFQLQNFVNEHIVSLKKRKVFSTKTIENWQKNIHSAEDLGKIWQLVTFEILMQTYFDSGFSSKSVE